MLASLFEQSLHPILLHELAGTNVVKREELAVENFSTVVESLGIKASVEVRYLLLTILERNLLPVLYGL